MMVLHLTRFDRLRFRVNGREIAFERGRRTLLYNECWLEFDAHEIGMRRGRNELSFTVKERNERISSPLSIEDIEVLVKYTPIWYSG